MAAAARAAGVAGAAAGFAGVGGFGAAVSVSGLVTSTSYEPTVALDDNTVPPPRLCAWIVPLNTAAWTWAA